MTAPPVEGRLGFNPSTVKQVGGLLVEGANAEGKVECFEVYLSRNGMLIGQLSWVISTHEVLDIWVRADEQRRGLATWLWHTAQVYDPEIRHSAWRTIDGQKWATSLGEGPLPKWRLA